METDSLIAGVVNFCSYVRGDADRYDLRQTCLVGPPTQIKHIRLVCLDAFHITNSSTLPPPTMTSVDMSTEQRVARLEEIIGWTFNNKLHAVEGLNHGGPVVFFEGQLYQEFPRNDRLAVLGDRLLDTVLLMKWYHQRSNQGKETLSYPDG